MPVWDLESKFSPRQICAALARTWVLDGPRLLPAADIRGCGVHCPITLEPFEDPVMLVDGFVYERSAVQQWLKTHDTAPCTNAPLRHKTALRLEPLRVAIELLLSSAWASNTPTLHELLSDALQQTESVFLGPASGEFEQRHALQALDSCLAKSRAELDALQAVVARAERLSGEMHAALDTAPVLLVQGVARAFLAQVTLQREKRRQVEARHRSAVRLQSVARARQTRGRLARERQAREQREQALRHAALQIRARARTLQARLALSDAHRALQLVEHLCRACARGADVRLVKCFIQRRADVNGRCSQGVTPLIAAISSGEHKDAVRCLCEARADLYAAVDNQATPLRVAAHFGHVEIVRYLCRLGAHKSGWEAGVQNPLHVAVARRHTEIVQLLCKFREVVESKDAKGSDEETALYIACELGDVDIASFLCRLGVSTNMGLSDGSCPIHVASRYGHAGVVRLLCNAGADRVAKRVDKSTAVHIAAGFGHVDVLRVLCGDGSLCDFPQGSGETPLYLGAQFGHAAVVRFLCGAGASKDVVRGVTPLHSACLGGFQDVVRVLCEEKADLERRSTNGSIPLYAACERGHAEIVRLLLHARARMKGARGSDCTPLHLAVQAGSLEIVQLLYRLGVDIDATMGSGEMSFRPLGRAVYHGHSEVARYLVEVGAVRKIPRCAVCTPHSLNIVRALSIADFM